MKHTPSRSTRRALIACAVLLGLLWLPTPAAASLSGTLADQPDTSMWQTDGMVRAIVQVGNVIYIGGRFSQLREKPVGIDGGAVVPVSNLAALDASTGKPVGYDPATKTTTFDPNVTGGTNPTVYALGVSGGTLYAGGKFTTVGGRSIKNLAAVDISDPGGSGYGAVDPSFNPKPAGVVWALTASSSRLYVGGKFTKVAGATRLRLAAFDLPGRALSSSWTPGTDDRVRDLELVPGGDGALMAVGDFYKATGADGATYDRRDVVRFLPSGDVDTAFQVPLSFFGTNNWGIDGFPYGNAFYFGTGGSDWVASVNLTTGQPNWKTDTSGSAQAVTVFGGQLIVGGHFKYMAYGPGFLSCYDQPERCVQRLRLAALDLSGTLDLDWYAPVSGHYNGVWVLLTAASETHVYLGGEFKKVGSTKRSYVARLARL